MSYPDFTDLAISEDPMKRIIVQLVSALWDTMRDKVMSKEELYYTMLARAINNKGGGIRAIG